MEDRSDAAKLTISSFHVIEQTLGHVALDSIWDLSVRHGDRAARRRFLCDARTKLSTICQTLPGLPRAARPSGRFAEGKTPRIYFGLNMRQ